MGFGPVTVVKKVLAVAVSGALLVGGSVLEGKTVVTPGVMEGVVVNSFAADGCGSAVKAVFCSESGSSSAATCNVGASGWKGVAVSGGTMEADITAGGVGQTRLTVTGRLQAERKIAIKMMCKTGVLPVLWGDEFLNSMRSLPAFVIDSADIYIIGVLFAAGVNRTVRPAVRNA